MTPDQIASWQKATLDATLACAQATLASAEQLIKLNLDAATSAIEQNSSAARELLASNDPQEMAKLRSRMAETSAQQSASYAQNVYEIVSETQAMLSKTVAQQLAHVNQDLLKVNNLDKVPGSEVAVAALKSSMAASAAMMENFNRMAKQFADVSGGALKGGAGAPRSGDATP